MAIAFEPDDPQYIHPARIKKIEGRGWWLWLYVVLVTVALTIGLGSFAIVGSSDKDSLYWFELREWVRGLAALVLLFDIYSIYQHLQLYRMRKQLAKQNELFRLISENAADMITVLDNEGHSLYNSPACQHVLGYSLAEFSRTPLMDLVHPEDRERVQEAQQEARFTGQEQRLEFRMSHQNGSWKILESSTSVARNEKGVIDRLVIVNRDITERRRAQEKLEYAALHDALTGLPNRTLLMRKLQHVLARARRHEDYRYALLFVDIDGFKIISDSLGPAAGDEFMVQIGLRLAVSLRGLETAPDLVEQKERDSASEDVLAKLPGDEFAILLDDLHGPTDALRVCERIQKNLAVPFTISGHDVAITVTIGVVFDADKTAQPSDLLRNAEIAMHRAKSGGKGRIEIFDSAMFGSAVKRLRLEAELRRGLERNEFKVFYQPLFDLQTGLISGFEALSRWAKPSGMVMPGEFIEVADQTGIMLTINRILMKEACRRLREWQSEYTASSSPLTMSVNVTARQFAQPTLTKEIADLLRQSQLDPATLQLEIVESMAMGSHETGQSLLGELKQLGVKLGIDDFGTGYSSLARLQQLPVDTLKIDRQFVSAMEATDGGREIVRVIVMLGHSIGLKVVAEGVETQSQATLLREMGCDHAQGYYFSRPIDDAGVLELLRKSMHQAQSVAHR